MTKNNNEAETNKLVEIQRNNVTLAEFFSYIKIQCAKKGLHFSLEHDHYEFENPRHEMNIDYYAKDGKKYYSTDNQAVLHEIKNISDKANFEVGAQITLRKQDDKTVEVNEKDSSQKLEHEDEEEYGQERHLIAFDPGKKRRSLGSTVRHPRLAGEKSLAQENNC